MVNHNYFKTLIFLSFLCLLSCSSKKGGDRENGNSQVRVDYPDFHYSSSDIVAPHSSDVSASRLPVDIYLDATYSMQGFAQSQPTNFSKLLGGIEAAVQNAAKSSDIRF